MIYNRALAMERGGRKVYHLEVGDPDISIDPMIIEEMYVKAKEGYIHYSESQGIEELRRCIVEYLYNKLNVSIDTDNILITPGSKTALYLFLNHFINKRRRVVVIEPAWGLYKKLVEELNLNYVPINTRMEKEWYPSNDSLDKLRKLDFKVLIILNPSNPTGMYFPNKIINEIMNIAEEKEAYVIGDEIYFDTIYNDKFDFPSVLKYQYKKAVGIYSFSKSHAMTGFRLGWIVGSRNIIDILRKRVQYIYTNVPVFIQYAGIKALMNRDMVKRNRKIYMKRVKILADPLRKLGFNFIYPKAAFYIFASIPSFLHDGNRFAYSLLDKTGVAVAPGSSFGNYQRYIRFAAAAREHVLHEAVEKLKDYIDSFPT